MGNNKKKVVWMYLLSFLAMFASTYAAVFAWDHIHFNINKIYMAILMIASMGVINSLVMPEMYGKTGRKYMLFGSFVVLIFSFFAIRFQTIVGDKQFLESMIPHHSSAILMCERASINDKEIMELCGEIVKTQREEIDIMKRFLEEKSF